MNANIPKISDIRKITRYHRKMIVGTVLRPEDSYPKRAERLKKLSFVDDDVKFQVLKESDLVSQELYDTLYALYFGEALPDQEGEDAAGNVANAAENEENAAEMQQKKTERRSYTIWDEADVMTLIHYYNKGTDTKELAAMFDRSTQQIRDKLKALKKNDKYREMINMDNGTKTEQEQKFEEIINSVDAGSRKEPETKDEEAKMEDLFQTICESNKNAALAFREMAMSTEAAAKAFHFPVNDSFCAEGTGLISTDGSIKLDDEPILAALRKAIVDSGSVQFYGTVQIIITPHKPTGMKVTRGAR